MKGIQPSVSYRYNLFMAIWTQNTMPVWLKPSNRYDRYVAQNTIRIKSVTYSCKAVNSKKLTFHATFRHVKRQAHHLLLVALC